MSVDGNRVGARKRQLEEHLRSQVSNRKTGDSSEPRQDHAFREELANDSVSCRAQRGAEGYLQLALHPSHQQQVGNVGTSNEEDEQGRSHQQLQIRFILLAKVLNACATRRQGHVRFFRQALVRLGGKDIGFFHPVPYQSAYFFLERPELGSWLHPANHIKPAGVWVM